ncbi:MAG: hypothetical protein J4400_04140 [Candidatus Aenigmarchaeota archaeon]|nr:hypothetical protein [Candidatus Aenigmarchaeota archaeon]
MRGQWFIISAVVASSIFLGMSLLLRDYFVVDSADTARVNNAFYFNSMEEQLDSILRETVTSQSNCVNLTTSLDELKWLAEKELASKGVFAKIEYNVAQCNVNPPAESVVKFDFIVASHDQIIYNFTTRKYPSELIG